MRAKWRWCARAVGWCATSDYLNLCATSSFSNKFNSISKEIKCNYLFIYIEIMLSLYLTNIIIAKTIVTSTTKKVKDHFFLSCILSIY